MDKLEFDVERCEQRRMLAGDLSVDYADGQLSIRGDGDDNGLLISARNEAGAFTLTGIGETTINGTTLDLIVTGVDDVNIDLRGGSDRVELAGELKFAGDVRISLRSGDDVLDATQAIGMEIEGHEQFDLGGGNDELLAMGSEDEPRSYHILGDVEIRSGGGRDFVYLGGMDADHDFTISSGGGMDEVLMTRCDADGDLTINTGGGADLLATYFTDVDGSMRVMSGGGKDHFFRAGDGIFGDLEINLGGGFDTDYVYEDGLPNGEMTIKGVDRTVEFAAEGAWLQALAVVEDDFFNLIFG